LPVLQTLSSAWLDDRGAPSTTAWLERIAAERVWGLGCLTGGVRCGVAWNTLFLALLTAAGTTALGTLIALMAERGNRRDARALQVLALLPIITPPFVVGLGLILLFGRAGLVNQGLEWAFGITPSRWFYGLLGVWLAQMFAFTPIAFMIMRGVVQGISPSLEEAAQTLRASRSATFRTVTLPLLKPGLANAFLVCFIESMADFGNPIVVGGQFSVLSTDIFFAISHIFLSVTNILTTISSATIMPSVHYIFSIITAVLFPVSYIFTSVANIFSAIKFVFNSVESLISLG
jgi:iron(III) transport system permease protein